MTNRIHRQLVSKIVFSNRFDIDGATYILKAYDNPEIIIYSLKYQSHIEGMLG